MSLCIGVVEALFRYPVKSMAGEALASAELGFHGLDGDRRLALRRLDEGGGFPWLSAGRLAELLLYTPVRAGEPPQAQWGDLPTHVRTPDGAELPILGEALAADIAARHGAPVEMMRLRNGVFDEADLSVIAADTVGELARLSALPSDVRRFRPNVLVRTERPGAFQEDAWVGATLVFGEGDAAPTMAVNQPDLRCSMINLDPDTAAKAPQVLKAVARANRANAGVYGATLRTGRLEVGQRVYLR